MTTLYSQRFARPIHITQHAQQRMIQRDMDEALVLDIIETGTLRHKDDKRIWVAKHYTDRTDNLICAAAVLEDRLVIKTVMHHFQWD